MKKRLSKKTRKESAERKLDQIRRLLLSGLSVPISLMLIATVIFPEDALTFLKEHPNKGIAA